MIVGYSFDKIEAKRSEISGKIDINSTINILDVKEREIDIGEKTKIVEITFEFTVEYKPFDGRIYLSGSVLYSGKNREIMKRWEKDKQLPEEVDIEVKNFILKKCLTLSILISEEIRMPSPLPFPMIVRKREESKNYIG